MHEKAKRKGMPRRSFANMGCSLLVAVLLGVGILALMIFNNAEKDETSRLFIAPADAALAPIAQNLQQYPDVIAQGSVASYIDGSLLVHEADYYLCLNIPAGVLMTVDLAALSIRVNDIAVSYTANTDAPLNCVLLGATLAHGWYVFEVQMLESATRQPIATYRWGMEVH